MNSPKLNYDINSMNYKYNAFTSTEKEDKNYFNKNKKISIDFGLNKKYKRKILSFNNILDNGNENEIYLDKNVINKLKCVKEQELVDKPLLINKKDYFSYDINKSSVENRIIELEYFTKKKFDELVQEIKIFIPIHFNSHIRNYKIMKEKNE